MQTSPFQSPGEIPPGGCGAAKPARPASVAVFGILNLVFGVLGLCGTAGSAAMFFTLPRDLRMRNPVLELVASSPGYRLFTQVTVGLTFIATIMLIVAGIGLLQTKWYGRTLSIGYSIYAIVSGIVELVVNFVFLIRPLLEQARAAGERPRTGRRHRWYHRRVIGRLFRHGLPDPAADLYVPPQRCRSS